MHARFEMPRRLMERDRKHEQNRDKDADSTQMSTNNFFQRAIDTGNKLLSNFSEKEIKDFTSEANNIFK